VAAADAEAPAGDAAARAGVKSRRFPLVPRPAKPEDSFFRESEPVIAGFPNVGNKGKHMRAGSAELLLMLQDFLEVGIWVWEPESGTVVWDEVLYKLYGVPQGESVTYDSWSGLVNPEDLAHTVAQAQRLLDKEIDTFDHTFEATRPDGGVITIRTVARLFEPANRPRYVMGCNVDISASRRVENHLALALDVTGIGIWDLDVKQNVLVWDDAMFRLYGVPRERFGNAYEAWEACVHPEDRERARVDVRDALAGTRDFDTTFRVIGPVGEERWIRARGKVFFDAEHAPVRMLGANMDISADMERARQLEEQRKINDHQAKLATIGELAAGVGHEINNPLAIILAGLELMQSRLARGDLSKELLADLIGKQRLAAERIKNITVGLRTFARAEGDEPVDFDVVESVGQTLLLVKELYGVAGIELVRDFADGPLWVRATPARSNRC
jgi:PAS domain S-box-containing protein